MEKMKFIQDEVWLVTFNAAFQRANVYKESADGQQKSVLRNILKLEIEHEILSDYNHEVSDAKHIENIYKIKRRSEDFSEILNNGSFSFGVCQKILNLYLKFQWCLDRIKSTPPHFPVDRRIQTALKIRNIVSWTTEMGEKEYMDIIKIAREKLKQFDEENIAELELFLFERRSNS
jgi:hypothetical protein